MGRVKRARLAQTEREYATFPGVDVTYGRGNRATRRPMHYIHVDNTLPNRKTRRQEGIRLPLDLLMAYAQHVTEEAAAVDAESESDAGE